MNYEPVYLPESEQFEVNAQISRRAVISGFVSLGLAAALNACGARTVAKPPTPETTVTTPSTTPEPVPTTPTSEAAGDKLPDATPGSIESLEHSYSENVRGIGDLEKRSGNKKLFTGLMEFLDMSPSDATSWEGDALEQAIQAQLRPLSIIQPVDAQGTKLDLDHSARLEPQLKEYTRALFGRLNQLGVNPTSLGPIVLCPEFIVGFGGKAANYVDYLNMFITNFHTIAPNAPLSNMIDLAEADALLPSLPKVLKNQLQTVGIQAFANAAPIPFDKKGNADVSGFLSATKIKQIARVFGNKPLWLNTGITREDANLGVRYSLEQRQAVGKAIAGEIAGLKRDGVQIEIVNLFAQNKLNGRLGDNSEKRDFSFHPGDEAIVTDFALALQKLDVKLFGFTFAHDRK